MSSGSDSNKAQTFFQFGNDAALKQNFEYAIEMYQRACKLAPDNQLYRSALRGIERKTLEAARSINLTWTQRIRHVVIPGALPQTLVGLRQSLGIAWLSLIVAETVAADSGLGYMINHARDFMQTDVIVVGLAVYALLGLTTDAVVRYLERRALAWRS